MWPDIRGSDGTQQPGESALVRYLQLCRESRAAKAIGNPGRLREEIERQRVYCVFGEIGRVPVPEIPEWLDKAPEGSRLLWQLDRGVSHVEDIERDAQ